MSSIISSVLLRRHPRIQVAADKTGACLNYTPALPRDKESTLPAGPLWFGIMMSMQTVVRERRRFFERPEEPRPMRITPRDVALVQNIARLRLSCTPQLAALDGGSAQNVSRALLALWENGYVERPEAQASSRYLYEGSRPAIYGLTRKGAALLREHGLDVRRRLLDGIDKEHGAGWRFIEHTVSIAEFIVRLELVARSRPDLRILERGDILEDAPKTNRDWSSWRRAFGLAEYSARTRRFPTRSLGCDSMIETATSCSKSIGERCRSSDTRMHSAHISQRRC
jgi:hypothetical protein